MRNNVIIRKMIGYCEKILAYCNGLDYDGFCSDSMLVDACVFNLSQIGELANKVDESFVASNREIPWRSLYGLRNRIVHDYEGVKLDKIWDIVSEDLVPLLDALKGIL